MATYYVRKTGSDAANGTSPATAWQTIGKALGAAGISSGDTVYIGAGTYRETITINMTSPAAETFVIGDVDGTQTGDAGLVYINAFTTNNTTAASGNAMNVNGRSNLTFKKFGFVGTTTYAVNFSSASSAIEFEDCFFLGGGVNGWLSAAPAKGLIWRRCRFLTHGSGSGSRAIVISANLHTTDYDTKCVVEDCLIVCHGDRGISTIVAGSGAGSPGNLIIRRNTVLGGQDAIRFSSTWATSLPCLIYGNILVGAAGSGIFAASSGFTLEDYNYITAATARTNVTAGTNSKVKGDIAPLFEVGQSELLGITRPFSIPTPESPFLGFGNQSGHEGTTDYFNRPRPSGSGLRNPTGNTSVAIGAMELHDSATVATDQYDATPSIVLVGPADQDIKVLVPASATTISVKVRYDTNHGTTNKPQAMLLANGELGYAGQTLTASVGVDTWETLTFSSFTPSKKGVVTLRLISRAAAGNGKAWFDSVAVA